MPRRTHSDATRPFPGSGVPLEPIETDLHRQWAHWRQRDALRAQEREQARRIEQFRRTYARPS